MRSWVKNRSGGCPTAALKRRTRAARELPNRATEFVEVPRLSQGSRRLALPNTRFLLHEPRGGVGGSASDVEIEAEQVLAMRSRLNQIFAEATGKSPEQIARDTRRNHWMNAQAALSYGLVGKIVSRNHSV